MRSRTVGTRAGRTPAAGTTPLRRRLARLGFAVAMLGACWATGFLWFAATIPEEVPDPDRAADAVVVLTGGSLRVEHGLDLLAAGKGRKLFVSGAHPGVSVPDLLRVSHQVPAWVTCCIELGHAADSTLGNAIETAAFMRREGFRSLRLVTAAYHMRRSLFEFRRVMPEIEIVPWPVFPDRVRSVWLSPRALALVATEYHKYLGALLRAAVTPRVGADASATTHAKGSAS